MIQTLDHLKDSLVVEINQGEEKMKQLAESLRLVTVEKTQVEHAMLLLQGQVSHARHILLRLEEVDP